LHRNCAADPAEKGDTMVLSFVAPKAAHLINSALPRVRHDFAMTSSQPSGQKPEIRTYAELQRHVQDALREQHPDWIGPNGDCSAYDVYERRFAELLALFAKKSP
jgi:hypothetical protein